MAALPFHYYLALREDWITANTVADAGDQLATAEEVVEFNAETFRGESV